jgi:adenine deaminase
LQTNRQGLERRIDQALGRMPADLVIRNARILDLVTGGLKRGDIAICDDLVVGLYDSYRGVQEIDANRRIAVPGFIDSPRSLRKHAGGARRIRPLRIASRHDHSDL